MCKPNIVYKRDRKHGLHDSPALTLRLGIDACLVLEPRVGLWATDYTGHALAHWGRGEFDNRVAPTLNGEQMKRFGRVLIVATGLSVLLSSNPLPATAGICKGNSAPCVTANDIKDDAVHPKHIKAVNSTEMQTTITTQAIQITAAVSPATVAVVKMTWKTQGEPTHPDTFGFPSPPRGLNDPSRLENLTPDGLIMPRTAYGNLRQDGGVV